MPHKIALIGCGRVGFFLEDDPLRAKPASHWGGIQKIIEEQCISQELRLVGLCDINQQQLKIIQEKNIPYLNNCQFYSDYKRLISIEKPDIIIIASWTSTHRDIAVYAAKQGVKGIVIEKPLAVNLNQAKEILDICQKYNVKLVVNHERRWGPLYRKTKEIIENQTLGKLKTIYGNVLSQSAPHGPWQMAIKKYGGGPLLHDGTHLIDILRFFIGDIESLYGYVKRENKDCGVETTAISLMKSNCGIPIFIETGGMREYFNFEMDLQFERGRIRIGNGIKEYYTSEISKRYTGFKDLVRQEFPLLPKDTNPFTGALLEVIKAIEKNSIPQSSGTDGYKAMEIIFAIYYSASLNGKTIQLPLKINFHPLLEMFKKKMI